MSQLRNIADFFKRSQPTLKKDEHSGDASKAPNPDNLDSAVHPSSSPLSDSPSSSAHASSYSPKTGPELQLKESLLRSIGESANRDTHQQTAGSGSAPGSSFLEASSNTSQRIIKNGKEVVLSSDGEDTDSIESLESPEDFFKKLTTPAPAPDKDIGAQTTDKDKTLRPKDTKPYKTIDSIFAPQVPVPKYKFTLESLVTETVDDNKIEAGVAKAKSALERSERADKGASNGAFAQVGGAIRQVGEEVLASALGEEEDETGLQRLLDAVRRTEAFDQEKTWSFFDQQVELPSPPEFPSDAILPGSKEAVLRDPASRERAFHSGIVEMALSRNLLPDELIVWILNSVPSEPRDDLRYAYCRALKLSSPKRIAFIVRPDDIDGVFRRLGASPTALDLSKRIVPEFSPINKDGSRDWRFLLSMLDLLRGAADLFADDTRIHILHILFRLALDASLVRNSMVCSELERTITAVLESLPHDTSDSIIHRVCETVFHTVQDSTLQSQLLKHILPTSPWISLFRCRLAVAFLLKDPSPLDEPPDAVLDLKRITNILREKRFDIKFYKGKKQGEYDYWELGGLTSLLSIAIDSGRSTPTFTDKEAETKFNADVDTLADRVKKIFTSIQDSGASHLKRTETKESLEALHYRIVYSVRSKPPPKKAFFGSSGLDNWEGISRSGSLMNRYLSSKKDKEGIPIREHSAGS